MIYTGTIIFERPLPIEGKKIITLRSQHIRMTNEGIFGVTDNEELFFVSYKNIHSIRDLSEYKGPKDNDVVKSGGFHRPTAKQLEEREKSLAEKGSDEAMRKTFEEIGVKPNDKEDTK